MGTRDVMFIEKVISSPPLWHTPKRDILLSSGLDNVWLEEGAAMGKKALYIDATLGMAGDMLCAALCGLMDDSEEFVRKLNINSPEAVCFTQETKETYGIAGTHMRVTVAGKEEDEALAEHHNHEHEHEGHMHSHEHDHDDHHHDHSHDHDDHHDHHHDHHHHEHTSMHTIGHIIDDLTIDEAAKNKMRDIYNTLAKAEAEVHGKEIEDIHFHEVGSLDAVADVMSAVLAIKELKVDAVYASPITTGFGTVKCAHGILPVPAPATAKIIEGLPVRAGKIEGELTTPTGAAILKNLVDEFRTRPDGVILKQSKGLGSRDYGSPSFVSAYIIELEDTEKSDQIIELSFNVDDCTGEELGLAMEMIFEAGAKDVFYTPVYMKKNRPGYLVNIITAADKEMDCVKAAFKYTTTIGMRKKICDRYVLDREIITEETADGPVRYKISQGYGVTKRKAEFDDIREIRKKE